MAITPTTARCGGFIRWSKPGVKPISGAWRPSPSLSDGCPFTNAGTFPEHSLPAMRNLTILGLWHLGCVTAAAMARHHRVTGLDFDEAVVAGLRAGRAPLHEPGLDDLLAAGVAAGRLS